MASDCEDNFPLKISHFQDKYQKLNIETLTLFLELISVQLLFIVNEWGMMGS